MKRETDWRRILIICVTFALLVTFGALCVTELLMPETGKKTKKNGGFVIDYSHIDQGYVMVKKSKKGKKKLKVRVTKGKEALNYDLNSDGEYEVFPLQFGSGNYTFHFYQNISGKKYSEEGKITLKAQIKDENSPYLYPNQYVNYNEETEAVLAAQGLCKDMTDQVEIYKAICGYMRTHFAYDYIKSVSVKAGLLPQIDECWEKHMGICQDLSAVMVAMLRSQGISAKLVIGTLNVSTYHAWVTAMVNGKEQFFDPTAALYAVSNGTYTVERWY